MWRSWDRPLVGYFTRLPDDHVLQRGVTFTILPDGRSMRVPVMNKLQVQAENQKHADGEGDDIMQALQNILKGRKTMPGEARRDVRGAAVNPRRPGQRVRHHEGIGGGHRGGVAEGLRGAAVVAPGGEHHGGLDG